MDHTPNKADIWLWLSVPIAVLAVVAAGAGLLTSGPYRDAPGLVAQAIGQDLITLVVAVPALLISAYLAARGSQRARLIWLGVLVYMAYTYASYSFGIRFNPMFLVYVALLGCASYALVGGLLTTDWAGIKSSFGERAPVKTVGIFLLVVAALFYLMWLSEALPASLSGVPPQSVTDDGTATNVIHVLDMGLLLPALVIAGVGLLRRQGLGFGLAGALLTNLVFLVLAILSMILFQAQGGANTEISQLVVFLLVFAVSLGMLIAHLRHLKAAPA